MVATDTHRLNLTQCTMEHMTQSLGLIVPSKTVLEMKKIAEHQGGMVEISMGKSQVRLKAGAYTLVSKVIDGVFPAYQDVIPMTHPYEIRIPVKEMDKALRRCMIVANAVTYDLCIQITPEGLNIAANNYEQEQSHEFVMVEGVENEMTIGFNGRYLRDILGSITSEEVSMKYRDELSPVLFEPTGLPGEKYIVMPMRID